MQPDTLLLLEVLAKSIAALFALLVAIFAVAEILANDENGPSRTWFRSRWERIHASGWLALPEEVVRQIVVGKDRFENHIVAKVWGVYLLDRGRALSLFATIAVYSAILIFWPETLPRFIQETQLLVWLGATYLVLTGIRLIAGKAGWKRPERLADLLENMLFLAIAIFVYIIILHFLVGLELLSSLLAAVVFIPLSALYLLHLTDHLASLGEWVKSAINRYAASLVSFYFAVSISFLVTMLSIFIGHVAVPDAWTPTTLQMLAINVLCDGITLLETFALLAWAIRKPGIFRIPIAIFLDVAIAAVLACLSLYLGLLGSPNQVAIDETLNVLIGRNPSGEGIELGPLFWVMHTTFLPTLAYLFVILACWIGKILLTPVHWFFGKAAENKRPLGLTGAVCGAFVALFLILGTAAESAYKLSTHRASQAAPAQARQ